MTKLEEVARAIARQEVVDRLGYPPSERDVDMLWRGSEAKARAAIEALRNPPEFVLDAMNPSGRYASTVVVEAWNDAIDAILSNTKEGG